MSKNNYSKFKFKNVISMLLALVMLVGMLPTMNVFAAQINEYVDPADVWITSNGRSNELDFNATVTQETVYCCVCKKDTVNLTYRVPEYTKSGETALNRGVKWSDGTMTDGYTKGNCDDGVPGVDAFYTTYHFTKSICQTCGTINSVDGEGAYCFNKNVYGLNSCDHAFFLDFDNTSYEQYNDNYHTTILKKGQYCQFCKGTKAQAVEQRESHNFKEIVDGQVGNSRFYVSETCDDCGYETNQYISAKSVVSSYYGVEDGESHTVTVSDLSDSGVHTSIRYGTSADRCNLTSAPNYTSAGYYPVYYEIDYRYDGESMTENGVSYVWLLADSESDNNGGDIVVVVPPAHEHDYHYLETVEPSCENLGYDIFQCNGCGELRKSNYKTQKNHNYKSVTIREATCKQGGLKLWLCDNCGDFYEETTPVASHSYKIVKHNATCRITGYTEHICEICSENFVTDITPIINHSFARITKEPTCVDKGYTTSTCTMCGYHFVSEHLEHLGHAWDDGHTVTNSTCDAEGVIEYHCKNANCTEKMIKATSANGHTPGIDATCTEPQRCTVCDTVLALPTGHNHIPTVVESTCTEMGYTVFLCDCGDLFYGDFTNTIEHDYDIKVTEPTCTSMGFSEYQCRNCSQKFVADYKDKIPHDYKATVTNPTCTEFGFTVYNCDCGSNYTSDYVDRLEHNYDKEVIPPTCTEHGYTVYKCPDCSKEFIGDIVSCEKHDFKETVVNPTCTEMGYSIFTCECGESFESSYKNPIGHTPSEWIVDTAATIESAGEKHIECTVCGERLMTVTLPKLIGRDFSDEDGNVVVGDYSIKLFDKDNMPVFNAEVTIDVDDNVSIILPDGRLLDFADQTSIEVTRTENGEAAPDIAIFVVDKNKNNATGKTDSSGMLKVPNNQSSTGDDNGTVGKEDNDKKDTFVVKVTDKTNTIIPDCEVYIGESNNLVVNLPDGIKPTTENPVIITVTDQNGNAKDNISVIALGEKDYIEKGKTDIYGKVTLPITNEGYTDENGKVNVNAVNVIVNDEIGLIPDAYVIYNEDGTINVTLPQDKSISYANRITVTVLDSMAKPINNVTVTVKDIAEKSYTAATDENGRIVVPPLSEDMTDNEGKAVVNGYNVLVVDEQKPIENAFVYIKDGKIYIDLPEGAVFDYANRITATVTDEDNASVKDMTVTFTDSTDKSETNLTDENGKATVPPVDVDYTDVNGYSVVDGFIVTVTSENGAIEKAHIKHNAEVKNDDETVKTAENITITLPENSKFDYANRITVTVLNKADNTPVKDMEVIVSEPPATDVEPKILKDKTNDKGIAVYPPLSEDMTDDKGDSGVEETKPGQGEDTDGDGKEDKPGENVTISYIVKVNDTKGIITGAFIEIKDGKVIVTLPETHTLTTSNQTTVTVLDKESKPIANVSVTVKDATTEKSATTNANGQITVPVKTSSGGGGGSSSSRPSSGGGGGGSYSMSTVNVKVTDKDGKTVNVTKSTGTDKVTLTLPTGKNLAKDDNYYTITVTDRSGKAKSDYAVILKDKSKNELTGKTDKNGVLVLPAKEHKAYIVGYDDGTFRPDSDMTRAEASAIFARLISEEKGESINGKASFSDVSSKEWYYSYVGYLDKYNIIKGYNDGTFRPNDKVTRAEFVAMAVRFYGLFNDVKKSGYTVNYTDLSSSYWAYNDIAYAKHIGWLNGYADGSFKPDNNITRAEVVTVTNHATGRTPDEDYITKNVTTLNRFTDLKNNAHWGYADIMEAANTHKAVTSVDSEGWVK